jgi:hypothetical protein
LRRYGKTDENRADAAGTTGQLARRHRLELFNNDGRQMDGDGFAVFGVA